MSIKFMSQSFKLFHGKTPTNHFPRKMSSLNQTVTSKPFVIAIEGNIGSGKSTFIEYFKNSSDNVDIRTEPIEKWIDFNGLNPLDRLYSDSKRWAFTFNMFATVTKLQSYLDPPVTKPILIHERSVDSSRCVFVHNSYLTGDMDKFELEMIHEWYNYLDTIGQNHVDLYVYLQASPQICLERIRARNRPAERSLNLDFLSRLHDLHEDWLVHHRVICPPSAPSPTRPLAVPVIVVKSVDGIDKMIDSLQEQRHDILGQYA